MKVLLINPSTPRFFEPRMLPMLGILYIGTAVREVGIEPYFWDMNFSEVPPTTEADVVMVTANSATYPIACQAADQITAPWKVIGGPHSTSLPEASIESIFNIAVRGEGELTTRDLLSALRDDKSLREVAGICFWDNTAVKTPERPFGLVNEFGWPAYDLWPELGQPSAVAVEGEDPGLGCSIITSRGCPFACNFCNLDVWQRHVRYRDADDVLAEVTYLRDRFGITHLRIQDDTVNLNKERFKRLCDGFKRLGIRWRAHTRSDQASLEEFQMMKESGCVEIGLGVESGSQKILDLMGKKETVEQHAEAIKIAKEAGLYPRVYIIVGFPGETPETVEETRQFLLRTRPHRAAINNFVPYPGTAVWKDPAAFRCKIVSQDWNTYWQVGLEEDEGFQCEIEGMTRDELIATRRSLQDEIERELGSTDRRTE